MNENLNEALDQIKDEHIQEAAGYQKRRRSLYFGAIAAVLAVAILVSALWWNPKPNPDTPPEVLYGSVARPVYPKMAPFKDHGEEGRKEWQESMAVQYDQPDGYADSLGTFFKESIPAFLAAAKGENAVCSPVNVYMALAMLAECAEGTSRQQILALMGADSIEELRQQASYVWNAHYRDDGYVKLLLGNSLWLDEAYTFRENTVNILAESHYASVFRGDLGSEKMNESLRDWINEQTGGLLKDQTADLALDPSTVLALASTIEYRVNWSSQFDEERNTKAPFHAAGGDVTATYMNQTSTGTYYWGENFCATSLRLEDSSTMWLILPDEGVTPAEILEQGTATELVMGNRDVVSSKSVRINLSLPKFDVSSNANLVDAISGMGVTEIFSDRTADLTGIAADGSRPYVSEIEHAARVLIDENGVEGAAYTVIMAPEGAIPPKDEVDFVPDRPFLFVITSRDGLPLFTGTMAAP